MTTSLMLLLTNSGRRFKAVHFRHLHVHKYQVYWLLIKDSEYFMPCAGYQHGMPMFLQQAHN